MIVDNNNDISNAVIESDSNAIEGNFEVNKQTKSENNKENTHSIFDYLGYYSFTVSNIFQRYEEYSEESKEEKNVNNDGNNEERNMKNNKAAISKQFYDEFREELDDLYFSYLSFVIQNNTKLTKLMTDYQSELEIHESLHTQIRDLLEYLDQPDLLLLFAISISSFPKSLISFSQNIINRPNNNEDEDEDEDEEKEGDKEELEINEAADNIQKQKKSNNEKNKNKNNLDSRHHLDINNNNNNNNNEHSKLVQFMNYISNYLSQKFSSLENIVNNNNNNESDNQDNNNNNADLIQRKSRKIQFLIFEFFYDKANYFFSRCSQLINANNESNQEEIDDDYVDQHNTQIKSISLFDLNRHHQSSIQNNNNTKIRKNSSNVLETVSSSSMNKKRKGTLKMSISLHSCINSYRYGKLLSLYNEEEAFELFLQSVQIIITIIQESRKSSIFNLSTKKLVSIFEEMAKIHPNSSEIRSYCDLFLIHFSNIAMRGEVKRISLDGLVLMVKSKEKQVNQSNALDILRHLAKFLENKVGKEASKQLELLKPFILTPSEKVAEFKKTLTSDERRRLIRTNLKDNEYNDHFDIILNILRWKPVFPASFLKFDITSSFSSRIKWKNEDPKRLFIDRYRITDEDRNGFEKIYLAKRKSDRMMVVLKTISSQSKYVQHEICFAEKIATECHSFPQILDIYHHDPLITIVFEYCDAGSLEDLNMLYGLKEYEIAYIANEVLKSLSYLHQNQLLHRNLTIDCILFNFSGEIIIGDFELWLGNNLTRYSLPPEQFLVNRKPYSYEADIWAFGYIIYQLANRRPMYYDYHPIREFLLIATNGAPPLKTPEKWSPEFKDFLSKCLHMSPKSRPSADDLLLHPFLRKSTTKAKFSEMLKEKISWTRFTDD